MIVQVQLFNDAINIMILDFLIKNFDNKWSLTPPMPINSFGGELVRKEKIDYYRTDIGYREFKL